MGTPEVNGVVPLQPGGSAVPAQPGAPSGGASGANAGAGNTNAGAGNMNGGNTGGAPGADPPSLERVLVFTRTLGFRHDSIGAGVQAIVTLGTANGFTVEQTEDPSSFSDAALGGFDVVVWLNTTADVLDANQQAAFERFIRAGGGWVGVHAASDTEYGWAWYGQLLGGGAYFLNHPAIQTVELNVEDAAHVSTAHLPASFDMQDEWYNFRANPRPSVSVLLRLNEASYQPGDGAMGQDHPIAWYHEFDGGRAWYTALGHRMELYQDTRFTQHLLGGIRWAAGVAP
jgi:type 1 glutamine amidotransferase